jgi:hypothetical protein
MTQSGYPVGKRLPRELFIAIEFICVAALVWLLCFGARVGVLAIQTLPSGKETGPLGDPYPSWALWHFASGLVFVVLSLLQLLGPLRRRFPGLHHLGGYAAIGAAYVAAVSAVVMAMILEGRPAFWRIWVAVQFVAIALMLTRAALAARRRDFKLHQSWMIRSIAVAGAVFTQRLVFPFFPRAFGIHSDREFWIQFTVAALVATAINLLVAEAWLRSRFRRFGGAPPY